MRLCRLVSRARRIVSVSGTSRSRSAITLVRSRGITAARGSSGRRRLGALTPQQEASLHLAAADHSAGRRRVVRTDRSRALARVHPAQQLLGVVVERAVQLFDGAFAAGCNYVDMAMNLSVPHPTKPYEKTGIRLGDGQFAESVLAMRAGGLPFRQVFSSQGPLFLPMAWLGDLLTFRTLDSPRAIAVFSGVALTVVTYIAGREITSRAGCRRATASAAAAGGHRIHCPQPRDGETARSAGTPC